MPKVSPTSPAARKGGLRSKKMMPPISKPPAKPRGRKSFTNRSPRKR